MIGVRSGLYGRGFACEGPPSGKGWLKRCLGAPLLSERFSDDKVVSALAVEDALIDFLLAPSTVNEFSSGNGVLAFLESSKFGGREGGCAIDKESLKMLRDGDRREEELPRGVYSSGWAIGWVALTGDEHCVDRDDVSGLAGQESVDALENFIDKFVPVSAHSPALNDAGVVAVDGDVLWAVNAAREGEQKELKSHCLCPCDVSLSLKCLPSGDESPGSPLFANDDSNTDARASIREGLVVCTRGRGEDAADGHSIFYCTLPPRELIAYGFIWPMGHEQFFRAHRHHAL